MILRKRFELSPVLGSIPISEVKILLKSRDELPPVLLALQTIFTNKASHQKMFKLVEPIVNLQQKSGHLNASSFMSLNISNHGIAMSENQLSNQNDGVYQKILQQKLKTP